jgi:hypothetical protein
MRASFTPTGSARTTHWTMMTDNISPPRGPLVSRNSPAVWAAALSLAALLAVGGCAVEPTTFPANGDEIPVEDMDAGFDVPPPEDDAEWQTSDTNVTPPPTDAESPEEDAELSGRWSSSNEGDGGQGFVTRDTDDRISSECEASCEAFRTECNGAEFVACMHACSTSTAASFECGTAACSDPTCGQDPCPTHCIAMNASCGADEETCRASCRQAVAAASESDQGIYRLACQSMMAQAKLTIGSVDSNCDGLEAACHAPSSACEDLCAKHGSACGASTGDEVACLLDCFVVEWNLGPDAVACRAADIAASTFGSCWLVLDPSYQCQ